MESYVNQLLSQWHGKPLEGAKKMIQKYGYPQEATMSRLIWYNNGPWKRTIIYKETVPHNFPTPHKGKPSITMYHYIYMMKLQHMIEVFT